MAIKKFAKQMGRAAMSGIKSGQKTMAKQANAVGSAVGKAAGKAAKTAMTGKSKFVSRGQIPDAVKKLKSKVKAGDFKMVNYKDKILKVNKKTGLTQELGLAAKQATAMKKNKAMDPTSNVKKAGSKAGAAMNALERRRKARVGMPGSKARGKGIK